MVEILKQGLLPSARKYFATCSNCKCEFKFQASEAKYISDQRDGDCYSIPCPTAGCGTVCFVSTRKFIED